MQMGQALRRGLAESTPALPDARRDAAPPPVDPTVVNRTNGVDEQRSNELLS